MEAGLDLFHAAEIGIQIIAGASCGFGQPARINIVWAFLEGTYLQAARAQGSGQPYGGH